MHVSQSPQMQPQPGIEPGLQPLTAAGPQKPPEAAHGSAAPTQATGTVTAEEKFTVSQGLKGLGMTLGRGLFSLAGAALAVPLAVVTGATIGLHALAKNDASVVKQDIGSIGKSLGEIYQGGGKDLALANKLFSAIGRAIIAPFVSSAKTSSPQAPVQARAETHATPSLKPPSSSQATEPAPAAAVTQAATGAEKATTQSTAQTTAGAFDPLRTTPPKAEPPKGGYKQVLLTRWTASPQQQNAQGKPFITYSPRTAPGRQPLNVVLSGAGVEQATPGHPIHAAMNAANDQLKPGGGGTNKGFTAVASEGQWVQMRDEYMEQKKEPMKAGDMAVMNWKGKEGLPTDPGRIEPKVLMHVLGPTPSEDDTNTAQTTGKFNMKDAQKIVYQSYKNYFAECRARGITSVQICGLSTGIFAEGLLPEPRAQWYWMVQDAIFTAITEEAQDPTSPITDIVYPTGGKIPWQEDDIKKRPVML